MRLITNAVSNLDKFAEWLLFDVLFSRRMRGFTIAAIGIAILAWNLGAGRSVAPAADTTDVVGQNERLLVGRPWIDRRPTNLKDPFCLYVFDRRKLDRQHLLGVYIFGNSLKHTFEFFGYQLKDGKVHFWFPNDDEKFQSAFTVEKERNGRFDLKLQMKADPRHDGRAYTYFGRMDGDLGLPAIDRTLATLVPDLGR